MSPRIGLFRRVRRRACRPRFSPVREWYAVAPDVAHMRRLLHPAIEFKVCAGWPNGGTFRGHDGVFNDFLPGATKAWEWIRPCVEEVIESGDTTVVLGRYEAAIRATGQQVSGDFVHVWRTSDGRLISMRQVADTAALAASQTVRTWG